MNDVRFVKDGVARAIRTLRTATTPEPGDRVMPLSAQMVGLRFTAAAQAAGIESRWAAVPNGRQHRTPARPRGPSGGLDCERAAGWLDMRQNPVGDPAATAAWNWETPRRRSSWKRCRPDCHCRQRYIRSLRRIHASRMAAPGEAGTDSGVPSAAA